jgi:hypothetical protein
VVTDYNDHRLAEQAVGRTGRWFAGHLVSAIAFVLSIPAISTIAESMRTTGRRLPAAVLPLASVGAGLYAAGLGADGIGPIAVQAAGSSPVLFFDGSGWWVTGVFMAGTALFGFALLLLVAGAIRSGLVAGWLRWMCFGSALLFMAAPAILSGWALYGVAAASFGLFGPLAYGVRARS